MTQRWLIMKYFPNAADATKGWWGMLLPRLFGEYGEYGVDGVYCCVFRWRGITYIDHFDYRGGVWPGTEPLWDHIDL